MNHLFSVVIFSSAQRKVSCVPMVASVTLRDAERARRPEGESQPTPFVLTKVHSGTDPFVLSFLSFR